MNAEESKYPKLFGEFKIAFEKIDLDKDDEDTIFDKIYDNYKRIKDENRFDIRPFIEELLKEVYPDDLDRRWQIKKINEDDTLIIRKGYTEKFIDNAITILSRKTSSILDNPIVDLLNPRCEFSIIGNWLWVFGRFFPTDNNDELIRYYFNLKFNTSNVFIFMGFLKGLISKLNNKGVSFKFKINCSNYDTSADSLVFYIEKFQFLACIEDFQLEYHKIKNILTDAETTTPLFTHKIATGWAFGEEPKTLDENFSFGQFRALKIKDSFFKNKEYILNQKGRDKQLSTAFTKFIEENKDNFDFENFHLNKDSILQLKKPLLFSTIFSTDTGLISYIDSTLILANHLCRNAIWDSYSNEIKDEKCNWLTVKKNNKNARSIYTVRGCNSSLGDGLAGISLFLIKVYEIYPSTTILNTIKGAINNCIDKNRQLSQNGLLFAQNGIILLYEAVKNLKELEYPKSKLEEIIKSIVLDDKIDFIIKQKLWAKLLGNIIYLLKSNVEDNSILKSYASKLDKVEINKDLYNRVGLNRLSSLALSFFKLGVFWVDIDSKLGDSLKNKAIEILNLEFNLFLEDKKKPDLSLMKGVSGMIYVRLQILIFTIDEQSFTIQNQINNLFSKVLTEFFGNGKYLKNEFTIDNGILGLLFVIKYYSNKVKNNLLIGEFQLNQIKYFLKDLYEQLISIQALPAMGVSIDDENKKSQIIVSEYYNPGILNGVSGLGLIYLSEDEKLNQELLSLFD